MVRTLFALVTACLVVGCVNASTPPPDVANAMATQNQPAASAATSSAAPATAAPPPAASTTP